MGKLLQVKDLTVTVKESNNKIIDKISFDIDEKETVGIVGESGCGKSMTATSIMGLLSSGVEISNGEILFKGENLNNLEPEKLRGMCGKHMGMIFQEPMKALNPLLKIEMQLSETFKIHTDLSKQEMHLKCLELLEMVGIKDGENILKCYPNELSGGMRQRILIAIAIAINPKLLIADEPTTALDVTIQAQILRIIKRLVKENDMSLLIISHDLGVIAELAKKVIVMYAGEIVEMDTVENLFKNPSHPYTRKLLSSALELEVGNKYLSVVDGSVPRPEEKIIGCKFAKRCSFATDECIKNKPLLKKKNDGDGIVRCHFYNKF